MDFLNHEQNITHNVKSLSNLITRCMNNAALQIDPDITGMQCAFIGYLMYHSEQDVFQKELGEKFLIRQSTVTGILQLMEKNSLIRRDAVDKDGRLKKITPTQKAAAFHVKFEQSLAAIESTITEGLSQKEKDDFILMIQKMKQNLLSTPLLTTNENFLGGSNIND